MSLLSELTAMMESEDLVNETAPDHDFEIAEAMNPEEGLDAGREAQALEPEIRTDLPNAEKAFVLGNPYEAAGEMDFKQGDNPYNAMGNCGLVSISNMLRAAGFDSSEEQITGYAIKNRLCEYDPDGIPSNNGGTTAEQRKELLRQMGIDSDICPSGTTGSLENIADAIDNSQGVVVSVNAGMLWETDDGSPLINGKPVANHCVMVSGYARDGETGEITGVYIVDSGRGNPADACRYLTREEFDDVYTNVYNSRANITCQPLKGA